MKKKNEKWVELKAWWAGLDNAPNWSARWWHFKEMLRIAVGRSPGETGQAIAGVAVVLGLITLIAGVATVNFTYTATTVARHADRVHSEAQMIRTEYNGKTQAEFYFASKRGTVLAIFEVSTGEIAGIVWRVTEDQGRRWLGDEAYECTTFVSTRKYWNKVIKRDGYLPLASFPSTSDLFFHWVSAQFDM